MKIIHCFKRWLQTAMHHFDDCWAPISSDAPIRMQHHVHQQHQCIYTLPFVDILQEPFRVVLVHSYFEHQQARVNSLWPSDAIWQHRSTLAPVMACCLMAPSHYLNQCWFFISEVLWCSPESYSMARVQATILSNEFENYTPMGIG